MVSRPFGPRVFVYGQAHTKRAFALGGGIPPGTKEGTSLPPPASLPHVREQASTHVTCSRTFQEVSINSLFSWLRGVQKSPGERKVLVCEQESKPFKTLSTNQRFTASQGLLSLRERTGVRPPATARASWRRRVLVFLPSAWHHKGDEPGLLKALAVTIDGARHGKGYPDRSVAATDGPFGLRSGNIGGPD